LLRKKRTWEITSSRPVRGVFSLSNRSGTRERGERRERRRKNGRRSSHRSNERREKSIFTEKTLQPPTLPEDTSLLRILERRGKGACTTCFSRLVESPSAQVGTARTSKTGKKRSLSSRTCRGRLENLCLQALGVEGEKGKRAALRLRKERPPCHIRRNSKRRLFGGGHASIRGRRWA